jgi:hypothetical protein
MSGENDDRLQVGQTGYYRLFGEYYPARVVANDIRQTGGAVDEIIVYTKWGYHEFSARTTRGYNSVDGGSWVTPERYEEVRAERRARAIEDFDKNWPTTNEGNSNAA